MSLIKRIVLILAVLLLVANTNIIFAAAPYPTYIYSYYGDSLASPASHVPYMVIDGQKLGVGDLVEPGDIFVSGEEIYLLDSGNNRIICMDKDWKVLKVIDGFSNEGRDDTFKKPQGIFVTENKEIYIADTENSRIVKLDYEGSLIQIFGPPKAEIITQDFVYLPTKISVDKARRMYIVAQGVNQGLIEMDASGSFIGYIGAPKVTPNLVDYFWKRISTKEQKKRMELFVPTEYNNICIDNEGFLYVTTSALDGFKLMNVIFNIDKATWGDVAPVKRLNPTGQDILRRNGYFPPVGDIRMSFESESTQRGPSTIMDVDVGDFGIYSLLDSKRGRIFTYDLDGNLLYIFGGIGTQQGTFLVPSAIEVFDNYIAVLDKGLSRLTVFSVTEYGKYVNEAVRLHYIGKYDAATAAWRKVLQYNSNFTQAHIGIGKAYLRQDNYREAMKSFKYANDRSNYSKAYKLYRKQVVGENSGLIFALIVLSLALYIAVKKTRIKKFVSREALKQNGIGKQS